MKLKGSCHCGKVVFTVSSKHPYPFNLCYCSICRKTAGGGGFAINLGGDYHSLKVSGENWISVYKAKLDDGMQANVCERRFCKKCGSALWVWDSRWPQLIHPFASAIDTPLPIPPARTHLMVASKSAWVEINFGNDDLKFEEYPVQSIEEWHVQHKLEK